MKKSVLAVICFTLMGIAPFTHAALPAYMTLEGDISGNIPGSVTDPPWEGMIEVVEYGHAMTLPFDSATGLPTGKLTHRPIRVTKNIDKASPVLAGVMDQKAPLTNVTIRFYHPNSSGATVHLYTIELTNALITSISQHIGSTDELISIPPRETLTFYYETITWTWEPDDIDASADWPTP